MSDWLHSPRTVIMGLVILALAYVNLRSYSSTLAEYSLTSRVGETFYVYLSQGFGNIISISSFFLIMVSEIPRRIAFQNDMLIRSSRAKWLKSQVLFCFAIVTLMLALLTVFSMALTLPCLSPGSGWSMRLEIDPDAPWILSYVPEFIRVLPPWQASLEAAAILFAFLFTMVLVILMCSLKGRPNLGLILYVFLLVLHFTVMWEYLPPSLRIMPINFSTVAGVASVFPDHELEEIPIVLMVYAALDLCLMGVMRLQVRAMDMRFTEKEKA
jgi:hypothetical protein